MKKNFLRLALFLTFSLIGSTSFAAVSTQLTITKTTTLEGTDASHFIALFGDHFSSPKLNFNCSNNESCIFVATTGGFGGELAETLLNGRTTATFKSESGDFILHCGTASVHFCNILQKNAVLP